MELRGNASVCFRILSYVLSNLWINTVSEAGTNTPLGFNYEFQISDEWIIKSFLLYETVYTNE